MAIETPIRISTNVDELQDESEFLGEITADEITPGSYGPQLHWAVKPLNFAIAGKTGWFHDWYKISRHKRSKMGALIAKTAEVWGRDQFLGTGALVGKRAWFVRQDITFGTDRQTGEELKAEAVLIPTRLMAPGDEALILTSPTAGGTGASAAPPPPLSAETYTDEAVDLLLATIDGAQADKLALVGARTNLPAPLKQALMSGGALEYLLEHELVMVDGDGKVVALAAEPVPAPKARAPRFAKS